MKYIISILFFTFFFSCQKKDFELELPEFVKFGMSEIYLNGELREDFEKFEFVARDGGEGLISLSIGFTSTLSNGKSFSLAGLSIGGIPTTEGIYELVIEFSHSDNAANAHFSFASGEEPAYEKYEEIFLDEGFVEISNLDTSNGIVEGRFKCNFKRTRKQIIFPTGYPKFLEFHGVFHDSLTIK